MNVATIKPILNWMCAALLGALLFGQLCVVLGRYAFGWNMLWMQELSSYFHVAFIVLAVPWALLANRHIRIDIFSSRFSKLLQRVVETSGFLFLLVPMMLAILIASSGYVSESWSVFEGSAEVSGLPGVFLLKTLLIVLPLLMLVAGLAFLVRRR